MKILRLRFKNLNSLNDEWSIDFTTNHYTTDSIFAIIGPTGAGKTTILDAICLALFGRTPRLPKITKAGNEIMSRHTGECYAEVEFETATGERFRSQWAQHRARKKADGELQAPRHEIAEAASGKILESRLRNVMALVESITGMDFDRFTRSMLLAQGGFAAFLQAAPDERAPILEEITGTAVYSAISRHVHERFRSEREKLEILRAQMSGIQLLSADQEKTIQDDLKQKHVSETELTQKSEQLNQAILWLDGMARLKDELESIQVQYERFQAESEAFIPQRERLFKAIKAAELDSEYALLSSLKKMQNDDSIALTNAQQLLPEKKTILADSEQTLRTAEETLREAKLCLKNEYEIIKKVRILDVQLNEKDASKTSVENDRTRLKRQKAALKRKIGTIGKKITSARETLATVENYLADHLSDAALVTEFTGIKHILSDYGDAQVRKDELLAARNKAVKKCKTAARKCAEVRDAFNALKSKVSHAKEALAKLEDSREKQLRQRELRSWREDRDGLVERVNLLLSIVDIPVKISDDKHALTLSEKKLTELSGHHQTLTDQLQAIIEKRLAQEREVAHLEKHVQLINKIRDLEAERLRLENGKPCPLCGSEHHPFAVTGVPETHASESDLIQARKLMDEYASQISSIKVKQAECMKDIDQTRQRINELGCKCEEEQQHLSQCLKQLDMENGPDITQQIIQDELTAARNQLGIVTERIKNVEQLDEALKAAHKQSQHMHDQLNQSERRLQNAQHKENEINVEVVRYETDLNASIEHCRRMQETAIDKVAPYGITDIAEGNIENVLKRLTERLSNWQSNHTQKADIEKQLATLQADVTTNHALLEKQRQDLNAAETAYADMLKQLESLHKSRHELYGDKDPDREEGRLEKQVDDNEKAVQAAVQKRDTAQKILQEIANRITTLRETVEHRDAEITENTKVFQDGFTQRGFAAEADFLAARLSKTQREDLSRQADELSQKQTELETRRKDRLEKLKSEKEKAVTQIPMEGLQLEQKTVAADLKMVGQEIGALKQRLDANKAARNQLQETIQAVENQKEEWQRWQTLHELIGSADGKKYRNFAQGLTFEVMVSYANLQLEKMTDRYLLIRDDLQPLELNVIDNYQAGEIRSTKNLSGGESFIVSLALSLGLSKMAGRNARIDSLFLDEGFGTLDDDALETALEALSGLQQDGKLIGIISHVPALKERIRTQIQVIPKSGGKSVISGPGCRKEKLADWVN